MIEITHAELMAVFEAWENEFRVNPDGFYTADEVAALEVASLSAKRTIAFTAYLRQVRGTVVDTGHEKASKPAETRENTSIDGGQNWAGMDGATAYWVIQRNANGWDDIRKMMHEWLSSNTQT